ncbi:MAG: hypothetical protein IPL21_16165 [Saprospirales bacterium]|nr:hypothetical protein [Saprospirales bacterium]
MSFLTTTSNKTIIVIALISILVPSLVIAMLKFHHEITHGINLNFFQNLMHV